MTHMNQQESCTVWTEHNASLSARKEGTQSCLTAGELGLLMSKQNPWWPCLSLPHQRQFKGKFKPAWIGQHKSPWSGGWGAGGLGVTVRICRAQLGPSRHGDISPSASTCSAQFSRSVVPDSLWPHEPCEQGSLSITNSRSLLKLTSITSVMPSNHLILCRPLPLPPSIFPSIRVFSIPAHRGVSSNPYWDSCGKLTRKLIKILGPWGQEHVVCGAPRPGVWIPRYLFSCSPPISSMREGERDDFWVREGKKGSERRKREKEWNNYIGEKQRVDGGRLEVVRLQATFYISVTAFLFCIFHVRHL